MLALGSRGDVEPCIALARTVQHEGCEVVILALDDFRELIESAGVQFASMGACLPRQHDSSRPVGWALTHAHRHQVIAVAGVQIWVRSVAGAVAESLERVVRPSDVVISGVLTLDGALALRAARGCQVALALFAPCIPTLHGPSLIEAVRPDSSSILNHLGGALTWSVGVRWSRPSGTILRRNLGLPRRVAVATSPTALRMPVLLAVSSLLVPTAADWPTGVSLTGSWVADHEHGRMPLADLVEFVERRPAPLYVGFGSAGNPSDIELIAEAARHAGVRVVTNVPRGSDVKTGLIERDVYLAEETPHTWLFPRMAGVIHHGSAGTTTTALGAGVPSAAVPHQFDQHYYARRLSQLCTGPEAVPRRRLNRESLARMMQAMVAGPHAAAYRRRAQEIRGRAARERGTETAIRALHRSGLL
ncbi:glycosyltransferase [Streptomyces sp. NPDC001340]